MGKSSGGTRDNSTARAMGGGRQEDIPKWSTTGENDGLDRCVTMV